MTALRQIAIRGRVLFVQYAPFLHLDAIVSIDTIYKSSIVVKTKLPFLFILIVFAFKMSSRYAVVADGPRVL